MEYGGGMEAACRPTSTCSVFCSTRTSTRIAPPVPVLVPAQWFAQQDEAVSISQVYLLWTDSSMRIVQLSTILPFFWQQYHIFGYNFPQLCNHLVLVYLSQDVVVQVWAQSRLWLSSSQLLLPYGSFSSFGTCKLCLFSIVTCSRLTCLIRLWQSILYFHEVRKE